MVEKPLEFLGSSLADLRAFPKDARQRAGFELHQVQQGRSPSDWRPMKLVGPGVIEVRVHTENEYRIFYVARFEEAVYVLHAFEKKTQKTPKREIELGRARWAQLLAMRAKRESSQRSER
jgi:phage-related protein